VACTVDRPTRWSVFGKNRKPISTDAKNARNAMASGQ
jgi:hypothetical protein